MFGNAIAKLPCNYGILKTLCPLVAAVRHGHRIRGKRFGIAKTIEQRLKCKLPFEVMFFLNIWSYFSLNKIRNFVSFLIFELLEMKDEFFDHFVDEEEKKKQFEEEKKAVDIGFPAARITRAEAANLKSEHRKMLQSNPEIEKLSRHLKCKNSFDSHLKSFSSKQLSGLAHF